MKRYKTLFIKYPDSFQFLVFNILFYLSMSLSRSVHSIWFDLNGSLLNYSISYSAMAFSGMFAGILGRRINYFNLRNLIRIGVILYSIGLLLRLFPNDWLISLISGLISGIGAATIILLLRTWAVGIGKEKDRVVMISLKRFSSSLGTSIGGILSGILLYCLIYFFHSMAYPIVLASASMLCLVTFFCIPKIDSFVDKSERAERILESSNYMKKRIIFFGIFSGLIASIFSPYLPVILRRQEISEVFIGPVLTILSLLTIYFSSIFSSRKVDNHKQGYYTLSELLISILTLLFSFHLKYYLVITILIIRVFFVNLSSITQELMELSIYPKEKISYFYGISQTSYFIGDTLGGFIGGWLFNQDMKYSIYLFSVLLLFNAVLFNRFYLRNNKNS